MNREELAAFLRSRRERVRPAEVGLPEGPRRRTPGLRRQEVAELAGMSVEYYVRLEQARGPRPSRQILQSLGRALMLSIDERAHLHHLAGRVVPPRSLPRRDVPDGVLHLLASLTDTPAFVLDAKYDVLAWNELAVSFIGDLSTVPESNRNVARWTFRAPDLAKHLTDEQESRFVRTLVSDLRTAVARYPDDETIPELVAELLRDSPEFGELWAEHDVATHRNLTKRLNHPIVGPIEFECQILLIPDRDQRVVLYSAAPGSASHEAMKHLREIQRLRTTA
ncbi:transcriptional regulator with XRE-family HTH domain [Allocatelliglobosispora scoriae]|uniref:Transcriptional regulator with XRE-family HTH domain n=1 Tax=Allocatelliglobosispora scoriae TaxID=643052 RepID=A0A841BPL0_9ACTN|nr:helix-turn-helix transcriptional regulator [Allocatelliglobosispora scoriae]MBB5871007.1 transcriptional regulator with XRE-family HTH domain [Allocatelliglobosispora scoriae]